MNPLSQETIERLALLVAGLLPGGAATELIAPLIPVVAHYVGRLFSGESCDDLEKEPLRRVDPIDAAELHAELDALAKEPPK